MWRLNSWEDYEIMGSTRCRRRRDRALETRNYAAFEAHTYERHGTISQTRDRRTRTRLLLAPIWNFTEHHGSRKKLDFCHSSEKLLWSWNFSLPLLLSTMMTCSKTRQGTKVNTNTNHLKSWFAPFVVYAAAQILREKDAWEKPEPEKTFWVESEEMTAGGFLSDSHCICWHDWKRFEIPLIWNEIQKTPEHKYTQCHADT